MNHANVKNDAKTLKWALIINLCSRLVVSLPRISSDVVLSSC
ncbi:MAG: hypothetical protein RLZZ262_1316 [Bacteroidota bacterium]